MGRVSTRSLRLSPHRPDGIYIRGLDDFALPLIELRHHIDELIKQFGPRAVLHPDAGHNNVSMVLQQPGPDPQAAYWLGVLEVVTGTIQMEVWCLYEAELEAFVRGVEDALHETEYPACRLSGRALDDFTNQTREWSSHARNRS